eukprot:TRINITY_DN21168_c0_g1_i1.p1 TRINITY_DN21168_c0_g1~~TRINITY_DN21168_c0_g1_i1.p1  ORF type:complete len:361 (+),score=87.85 TRINITY_DN21168_c0_g1_i1:93-1175(+)
MAEEPTPPPEPEGGGPGLGLYMSFGDSGPPDAEDDEPASPAAGSPKRRHYKNRMGNARRQPVMGESITGADIDNYRPPVFPKDEVSQEALRSILHSNPRWQVLCGNVDANTMGDFINAFAEFDVGQGETLIQQGDEGDRLYICRDGEVDVFVARPGPDGVTDYSQPGPKVATLGPGSLFGELALMYSSPRAATIIVSSPSCKLWTLDRQDFKMLLASHGEQRYQKYEGWLQSVELLKTLNHFELSQLSEAMESHLFEADEVIIKEGDVGDAFYILEEGTCAAFISGDQGEVQVKAYTQMGEYFGEIALMQDTPRRATVRATSDCSVVSLSRESFTALLGPLQEILQLRVAAYPSYASFVG